MSGGKPLEIRNENQSRDSIDQDLANARRGSDVSIGASNADHVGQKSGEGQLSPIGSDQRSKGGDSSAESWGYRSNLAPLACWKIDAKAVVRNDQDVDLTFDSVAFDVVIDFSSQRQER